MTSEAALFPGYTNPTLIGEGGYGLVYRAEQASTGQRVAIKVLKLDPAAEEMRRKYQIARFERETQLCAELSHPHIVTLLDKGWTKDEVPYAVFEYIEGETLKDMIVRQSGLSAEETGELMGQVLDALAAAHAKGIVHRDLKPHNIMIQQAGSQKHVKILDFGIGAFTREFRTNDYQSLTLTREVMGTPAYSAPEQLRGEPATVKSDLYAWGLVCIECLTGTPVMREDSVAEVFQQQLNAENVPLPPALAGHSLSELLRRALHKNARLRTGDAAGLYEDFRRINFSTLVGNISSLAPTTTASANEAVTAANPMAWQDRRSEKRQITVLVVKLSLEVAPESSLDLETLDAILKDQINQVKDTIVRFGGYIAGSLGNNIQGYFGYPAVTDNDARRAGRTALEVMGNVRQRSALLHAQHGILLHVRMGIHSGQVLTPPNQIPEGAVPNMAIDLLYQTRPGTVIASEATKKLLEPYLEFEAPGNQRDAHLPHEANTWLITGERQTEALSFLRPWSANREMIGRETERNTLHGDWDAVKSGHGKAVVLHGQAGIGKSKMVYEIKKQVRSDGYIFREARSLPEHQNNALFPFLDMLRQHWGIAGMQDGAAIFQVLEKEIGAAGADLEKGLPVLCFWLSVPLQEGYSMPEETPDVQKQLLFELLETSIRHLGQEKPLMLVIEDLHWLDPTGREFVEYLLKDLAEKPFFLLMTTRPVFIPEWQQDTLSYVELHPLNETSTEQMVSIVLEGKNIHTDALTYINDRADGIPLYLEELTRMLVEEGYLTDQDGTYQFAAETDIQAIPPTLQDLLNARLDRLGLAKETAQIAGTIGREFGYELLVRSSLRDEASIQTDLDALMDADLIYRQRKVNGDAYIFRHALIRDAAYDGMVSGARKDHHLRIAGTLKENFPETVEENPFEVARHLAGGEEFEEGSEFGIKAIAKQLERHSNQEAIDAGHSIRNWISKIGHEEKKVRLEMQLNY
ncbi:MAG: TOMM system kinase/cyclase fusion protein, partial [Bacteroidota bacterium]